MSKYDVRFCSCGRVHFIENEQISKAIKQDKQVLFICSHCGDSSVIGADKTIDEYAKGDCYTMYTYDVDNSIISDTNKIDSIVLSRGERIIMATGNEATYHGQQFIDWETKRPDDVPENVWCKTRETVDTETTIRFIKDDEKLKDMSGYLVGISWKGTKYENDWEK